MRTESILENYIIFVKRFNGLGTGSGPDEMQILRPEPGSEPDRVRVQILPDGLYRGCPAIRIGIYRKSKDVTGFRLTRYRRTFSDPMGWFEPG